MPLLYLSCAWVIGILLGAEFNLPLIFILSGLIPLFLFFFTRRHRKAIILASVSLTVLFAASAYSHSSLQTITESNLRFYNDRGLTEIRGMIGRDPEVRDQTTHLHLQTREIKLANEWQEISGTALLILPRYPNIYKYGDILQVTGDLKTPPQFDDFDYAGYLAHQGIYSTMLYPRIEIEERGKGFQPLGWVYSVRGHVSQTLATVLPEPQASLAQGIILGIRSNIPASTRTDFARTGTAHLLAISGLHLSIIVGIMLSIGTRLFGRRHYLYIWLALGIIWLYALLTGMHPPIIRGAIMASLFLTAELLGRQRSAITALAFAAAIMVGISPYILWDVSFQLSFLAMSGLVFLFPTFRNLGRKAIISNLDEDSPLSSIATVASDSLSATLAAVIAIWPLVAYYFGIISLVGPLATLLALPALPGIIIAGTLTGVLGFMALAAAQVIGWLTWLFLSYVLLIVNSLATPSLSFLEIKSVNPTLLWSYYLVLGTVFFIIWKKPSRPALKAITQLKSGVSKSVNLFSRLPVKWLVPSLTVIAIAVSFTAITAPDDKLHVSFLDVGQGDAVFIQQGNLQILIDGGPSPQAISLELGRKMPFWDRTIDLIVLTHPHQDHLAGLAEVLRRFQVKMVLLPELAYDSPLYDEWLALIEEKGIPVTIARAGQQIELGNGIIIKVFSPEVTPLTGQDPDIDNNGVALRLINDHISFFFAGDIRQEREWALIRQRADLTSTVLKVAHHGSDTSTTAEFLATVNPQVAIISAGTDNKFGHPGDEVLDRLAQVSGQENIYRTDEQGTIEFITDGERLWVKTEK